MTDPSTPRSALLDGLPEDLDQLSVVDEARLIGRFMWELTGRSIGRLILTFLAVFVASFLPALLLILGLTPATSTYTRGGLLIVVLLCLVPIGAIASFNYVTYRGLRDVVEKLAFGQKIGAGFVAFLEPTDRMRIPLTDFTDQLKGYFTRTRREARPQAGGVRGLLIRTVNRMVFYTARFVLNRIARGCVVDGQVDLERFATAVGERADSMLISYFKKLLWDLTSYILSVAVLVLWVLIVVTIQLIKLFA